MPAAVALTRRKGTPHPTIATIQRHRARTRRPLVPIPRQAGPTRLRAAATAAVALLMLVVAEAPRTVVVVVPRTVEAVERPMAVAADLTAIVKISAITAFRKGPPLFNEAGLLLS
jgi:hypothetical protein